MNNMAGIKNIRQIYGATPFSQVKGDGILDRHLNFTMQKNPIYCRFCGEEIIECSVDRNNKEVDYQWEMQYMLHQSCLNKKINK